MNKPSPSEIRKREKGIKSFEDDWYFDTATQEVRRKEKTGWKKYLSWFWKSKYKVSDMYWWSAKHSATSEMIVYPVPLKHDDLPLRGFPRKHKLQGDWSISREDLKYLFDGPLFDQSGHVLLVKHQTNLQKFVSIVGQLKPISWVLGFSFFCVRYWNEILVIFNKFKNVI
jgi:hypothetical protein